MALHLASHLVLTSLLSLSVAQDRPASQGTRLDDLVQRARRDDLAAHTELGRRGADGMRALVALLEDRKLPERPRWYAANVLGTSGMKEAVPALTRTLADDVMNVRRCSAGALASLGATEALPALERLAKEDTFAWNDPQTREDRYLVREAAAEAIAKLTGKAPPSVPRRSPAKTRGTSGPVYDPKTGTRFSDRLPWADTIEHALARAKTEKKLVLATVVPVQDQRWIAGFADAEQARGAVAPHPWGDERVATIDAGLVLERVMLATLFGDDGVAALVNAHFVPVRVRLHTYAFDELGHRSARDPLTQLGTNGLDSCAPAIIVASPDGALVHACTRLGVFSADAMRAMLRAVLVARGVPEEKLDAAPVRSASVVSAREALATGAFAAARARLASVDADAEIDYLHAVAIAKLGAHDDARARFEKLAKDDADGPWGARAELRLAPLGMQLEAWEGFAAHAGDPLAPATESAHAREALERIVTRALDYLLQSQSGDGSWPDPLVDPHPMARKASQYDRAVARTGLCVDALMQMQAAARDPKLARDAIQRGIAFVGAFADDPEPWIWQLTYALHLQVALLHLPAAPEADKATARGRASKLVASLITIQHEGGWSYMPPPRIHSFNTAPVLLLLADLRDAGVSPSAAQSTSAGAAAKFLEGLRRGSEPAEFSYATNVRHDHLGSSSCRTAACELALLHHAHAAKARANADLSALRRGVELFFEHEPKVRATTKVFESYFSPTAMHDAYHYFFGHYYVARALEHLPRPEARSYAQKQLAILLRHVESDGSFVDAHMQGKSYATAMALLTIARLRGLMGT